MVLASICALVSGPPALSAEQEAEKIWLKPGDTHYDSISMDIRCDIFDKLPRGLPGLGGFSLTAETQGKPPFINHRVSDAEATKLESGFFPKCELDIFYSISAANDSPEGVFTYDVIYNLQNGLLTIPRRYVLEVSWDKPAWLEEAEKEMESFSILARQIAGPVFFVSLTALFVGLPGFFVIRKLRKPLNERAKVGWRRAILGVAIIVFTVYLVVDSLRYLPTVPNPFEYLVTMVIFAVGFTLISILILKR